jgi:hypothetical protein
MPASNDDSAQRRFMNNSRESCPQVGGSGAPAARRRDQVGHPVAGEIGEIEEALHGK